MCQCANSNLLSSATDIIYLKVTQSCLSLWNSMDYTVHGILQARILEWIAVPFSRRFSQPRHRSRSPKLQADSLPAEPLRKHPYEIRWKTYLFWSCRGVHGWTGPCAVFVPRGSGAELELILAGSPHPQGMLAAWWEGRQRLHQRQVWAEASVLTGCTHPTGLCGSQGAGAELWWLGPNSFHPL